MERYDYKEAVLDDVREYINENYTDDEIRERLTDDRDDFYEELNKRMWIADSVTGNASGSYYCNAWKAEEALCHNTELLGEALKEFGCDSSYLERGAEACDVTIRCYLLGKSISQVLDEIEEQLRKAKSKMKIKQNY